MAGLRIVFGLLLAACLGCFAMALIKRDPRWQRRGVRLLSWTLFAAFGFFAVLIAQRLLA